MTDSPHGRTVHLPGRGRTHVLEAPGPAGAPTVVLLHGLGATAGINWAGSMEQLSQRYRVLAPDQRGHGRRPLSLRLFTLEDCADDVAALADAVGEDRVIVAGYSMGGPITLLARRRHPERVAGIVLCATSAHFGGADPRYGRSLQYLRTTMRLTPPHVRRQMMGTMMRHYDGGAALHPDFAAEAGRNDPAAVLDAVAAVTRFDARSWLDELSVPAASVVTTRDRYVPVARQLELAHATGAAIVSVTADHDVAMRRADVFAPALLQACDIVVRGAGLSPEPASRR
jgi:3-oxoadipate enol-lactonase